MATGNMYFWLNLLNLHLSKYLKLVSSRKLILTKNLKVFRILYSVLKKIDSLKLLIKGMHLIQRHLLV